MEPTTEPDELASLLRQTSHLLELSDQKEEASLQQIAALTELLAQKEEILLEMTESRDLQASLTHEMESLWLAAKSRTRAEVALKLKVQSDFQSQVHYIIYLKMKHEDEVALLKEEGRLKDEAIGQLKRTINLLKEDLTKAQAHLTRKDQASGSEAPMLRAYSSDIKRQSFSILKTLSAELKQGLAASSRYVPSALQSAPSASQLAPPAPGQEEASACSANLSAIQYASHLQRENEVLKARLEELELPLTPRDPLNPTPEDLAHYLQLIGESAESVCNISHAAFDKIKTLEAALQTSESKLAFEVERRRSLVVELDAKDARLTSLQEAQEALQKTLTDVQGQLASSSDREKAFHSQWEASQATLKSMQADLLKAQEDVSQGQQDLTLARANAEKARVDTEKAQVELTDYQAGEVGRLRAYRQAYVTSPFFLRKIRDLMNFMLCCGAAGGARQMFEQDLLCVAPSEDFLDIARLMREIPDESLPSFKDDDDLFLLPEPPADAAPCPPEPPVNPTDNDP
ncbi:myosin heavy chain, embryonic smooth muscle isoform-like [Zingiber officinale]|uniref:myosin heavy chain, embryonic smooth muscle isoform-like n=1 Tax=Zingiber officinale TaxID=94328 RepID=UPI001C4B975A|nr:myosin heavy chain, embryonic smooth muscle isoform-like [Zingiber officinale]